MPQDQGVGLGAIFQIGTSTSPTVFTAVGRITNITGPGITRGSVEATTMDAAGDVRHGADGDEHGADHDGAGEDGRV